MHFFRLPATPRQIILNFHDVFALERHSKLKYGYSTLQKPISMQLDTF